DLQGKCDSLHTNQQSGVTKMFRNPILWSDGNQITGDTIHLISDINTEQLDSLKVLNNAFIVSKDSLATNEYNQIKGRNMFGKFIANKLDLLLVKGNAESIYYNRSEETGDIETITKEISSNIEFTLEKGQIISMKYLKSSDGKTHPPSQFPESETKLNGFVWRAKEQPMTKNDIFTKNKGKDPSENKEKKSRTSLLRIDTKKTTKKL
ncbi:MAG: OstA-like protein, partial [Flavobacteriales bacterium]